MQAEIGTKKVREALLPADSCNNKPLYQFLGFLKR